MNNILITKFPLSSRYGGGEKHTLEVVEALSRRGYNFFSLGSCRVLRDEFRRRRVPLHYLWAGIEPVTPAAVVLFPVTALPVFFLLVIALVYYRLIKKVKTLYCLSLTEKLLLPLVARLLGTRIYFVEHRMVDRWLTKNPLRFLYAFQSRFATTIAVSQALAQQLTTIGVSEKRIRVVYVGIDLQQFPWPRRREEHQTSFIVGTVAGLEPGKGIAYLLKAILEVREHIPNIRVLVIGTGPERKKLVWLASQLGLREAVQWVGFQREAQRWYNHFDVFVLPSIKAESFGIVVIEAMAAGVPVIATRLGGVPEIIQDGVNGLLVPPGDAHAIAEKILSLYYHRERIAALAGAARKSVEERFRHDTMIRHMIKLFDERA